MEPLNMCMFATRVDYDAAVRKRCEQESVAEKQQTHSVAKPLDENQDNVYNAHFLK